MMATVLKYTTTELLQDLLRGHWHTNWGFANHPQTRIEQSIQDNTGRMERSNQKWNGLLEWRAPFQQKEKRAAVENHEEWRHS